MFALVLAFIFVKLETLRVLPLFEHGSLRGLKHAHKVSEIGFVPVSVAQRYLMQDLV